MAWKLVPGTNYALVEEVRRERLGNIDAQAEAEEADAKADEAAATPR